MGGNWGVNTLNKLCEAVLQKAGLLKSLPTEQQTAYSNWYQGRPIMITQNNYQLGLYNGDIGLCLMDDAAQLRVYFQMADGSISDFQPSRLPSHETVFAMTVHKSQGSEFSHVMLMLVQSAKVINKELVYTAITRAKQQFTFFGVPRILQQAIAKTTKRTSGLADKIWQIKELN